MELETPSGLKLRMGPIAKDDLSSFVGPDAMHSHVSSRYLGRIAAPTIEDEHEWYDHMRSSDGMYWGLFVGQSDGWKLIGGTSLNGINKAHIMRRATSGILIFNKDYWGKGIAGVSHAARTYFAFRELGLGAVYSKVFHVNEASRRAIEAVGYVHIGTNRCEDMRAGTWLHADHFELINPDDWVWDAWWSGDEPSDSFLAARKLTKEKLAWAEEHVNFT